MQKGEEQQPFERASSIPMEIDEEARPEYYND